MSVLEDSDAPTPRQFGEWKKQCATTFASRDALDQWSSGHGEDFLNQYKSEIDIKYHAEISDAAGTSAPREENFFDLLAEFGDFGTSVDELLKAVADAVKAGKFTQTKAYRIFYVVFLLVQRNSLDVNITGGASTTTEEATAKRTAPIAVDEPAATNTTTQRRNFTPLPLRDNNVSLAIQAVNNHPEFNDLPEFDVARDNDGKAVHPRAIVGVIDDAANFAHDRFRANWGTRTEFAWIQDARALDPRPSDTIPDHIKDPVFFGREYYRKQIDAVHTKWADDQDELLKAFELGPTDTEDRPVGYLHGSHGTHVADLATGYGPKDTTHHDIRLMTVQLPALAYFDNSGMAMSYFILEAAKFVLWRSLFVQFMTNVEQVLNGEEPTKLPVVLNISYGLAGGPHSGGHYLEEGLDKLISEFTQDLPELFQVGPVDVVIPSGNDFLTRRFATARRGEAELEVTMRVPAKDRTSNFLEFWLPEQVDHKVWVTICPPAGLKKLDRTELEMNKPIELYTDGQVIARLTLDSPFTQAPALSRVLLAIAPTDTSETEDKGARPPAEPGQWKIKVEGVVGPNDVIEAYIHGEDPNNGFPRRDPPCYFDELDYERFEESYKDWQLRDNDSVVKRFGTLNGFGNGRFATVVGAYRIKSLEESLYTGAGRSQGQSYFGRVPTLMATADLSRLNRGILATGTRSGSSFTQTGTSISAPFVTRAIAELSKDGLSSVSDVVQLALDFEHQIGHQPTILPQQKGEGRLPLRISTEEQERQYLRGLYQV